MRYVGWNDNCGTGSRTCIHGYFDFSDMQVLEQLAPSGFFTQTFYHSMLSSYNSPDSTDHKRLFGMEDRPYYFTFSESDVPQVIAMLRLRGHVVKRGVPRVQMIKENRI